MRKLSRTGSVAAGVLALAVTAGAFAYTPAATAGQSAAAGPAATAVARSLKSIQPGHPAKPVRRGRPAGAPTTLVNGTTSWETPNWAGYAVTQAKTTFRSVSASFYVPYLDCTGVPANNSTASSQWVGLDGWSDGTVEQTGLLSACVPDSTGQPAPSYSVFFETYPKAAYYGVMVVHPGDALTASVSYSSSTHKYAFTVKDSTIGQTFSHAQPCPAGSTCARSSAEVISEAPMDSTTGNILPLADIQAATFSSATVTNSSGTKGGLSSSNWATNWIYQVSNGTNTDANGTTIPSGTVIDAVTPLVGSKLFDAYWMPGT